MKLWKALATRVMSGDLRKSSYLVYHYSLLWVYGALYGKSFAISNRPDEMGHPAHSTGNFPAHPFIVRNYFKTMNLPKDANIIDIGSGSGVVLHVAEQFGHRNLTGVELGKEPFEISKRNLAATTKLINGDALTVDLSPYSALLFFRPFTGVPAAQFMQRIPPNIRTVLNVATGDTHDKCLAEKGYEMVYQYDHPVIKNFSGKIWKLPS
jgi:protein-L-isoaspartate O-methyltransferase